MYAYFSDGIYYQKAKYGDSEIVVSLLKTRYS